MSSLEAALFSEQTPWVSLVITRKVAADDTTTFQEETLNHKILAPQVYSYDPDNNQVTGQPFDQHMIRNMPDTILKLPNRNVLKRLLTVCDDRPYPFLVRIAASPMGNNPANFLSTVNCTPVPQPQPPPP